MKVLASTMMHIFLPVILVTCPFFINSTTSQSNGYDPWIDVNDYGKIDMRDIGVLARAFGTTGAPINKTDLLLSLNATVTELKAKLDAEVGRIYIPFLENGTICVARSGGCVLKWDGQNFDFLLDNTSGDWLDFWYFNKETYGQGAIITGTTNYKLIDWANNNDDAAEIHFGQADGTEGYCSVWVQYANGRLVGHYIRY